METTPIMQTGNTEVGGDTNISEASGDCIGSAATIIEEQVVRQNNLEETLKKEVLELQKFCGKRMEELAGLKQVKWELEEKLQVLDIQNELMNEELARENKEFEAEIMGIAKLEEAIQDEKAKQIKMVEVYEQQMNQLCQQLDSLPSQYDPQRMLSDIEDLQGKTLVSRQKLVALEEETQLYKDRYESLTAGEETTLIDVLSSIRTELEETAREINVENEENEKMLECMRSEAMQLKQDIARLKKLS